MKKFFLTVSLAGVMFFLLAQSEVSWSRFRAADETRVHKVQKGESLSQLAKKHYGSTKRWRELALANRAPKPNHLEAGEEIILPSKDTINKLRRSRTITRANALIDGQQQTVASTASTVEKPLTPVNVIDDAVSTAATKTPASDLPENQSVIPETAPAEIAPVEPEVAEAGFPWFWMAVGVMLIAGVIGFVWYRRKQAENAEIEVAVVEHGNGFAERSRDRHPFAKPAKEKEKENVTV